MNLTREVRTVPGSIKRLFDCFLVWEPVPQGEYSKADCIFVQSFGVWQNEDCNDMAKLSGPINRDLAILAASLSADLGDLPIFAQWEVAAAKPDWCNAEIYTISGPGEGYIDTYGVIHCAAEWSKCLGLSSPIVVAQYYHLPRCVWIAEKLGLEVNTPYSLIDQLKHNVDLWDPSSSQAHRQVTAPIHWFWRDLVARLIFWLRGNI